MTKQFSQRRHWAWALFAVLLVAGAVRLPIWLAYPPATAPDTGTYVQAAKDLVSGDFSTGQGRRTPGYPLLLAAAGGDFDSVVALQVIGGLATTALIYWMALQLTRRHGWAVAAALAHGLNLQQLFTEGLILTEAASALSVAVTLALLLLACTKAAGTLRLGWMLLLVLLGVMAAYAMFIRPQFLVLFLIAPLSVMWSCARQGAAAGRTLVAGAFVLAPAVALVLAWGAVQKEKTGYFTLSTQSGFGLVNHAIDFIELAPDAYAPARDVLKQTRERRIQEVGHSRNTIWYAWPEIQRVTGWTLPGASRHLQAMCRQMFVEHPWRYARSVASAWVDFWTVPIFWKPEQVNPTVRSAVEATWWVQHKLLRLANLAFVLVVAAVCVWPAFRRRVQWDVALSAIAATVLMSSLIQALADQGASSRYHLPTQSLVVLVLLIVAARWWSARQPAEDPRRLVRTAA